MSQAIKIFISYRRSDNPDFVDRIWDWFVIRYGRDYVFIDVDSTPPAVRFADFIREQVEQCDLMIVIIGPQWLKLMREKAITFEEDYVRIEIGLALQLGKPVAPICIAGASMPNKTDLPGDLYPLLNYNAAFLERRNFLDQITHVVDAVEQSLNHDNNRKAQEYYNSGDAKWHAGDYEGAINDCSIAIQLKPDLFLAYNRRGTARYAVGDHKGALADYADAIRLNPQFPYIYYNRAIVYQSESNHESAIADYTKAIDLNPEFAYAYIRRGASLDAKGDHESAIADYNEAIRLNPHYVTAYYYRGVARHAKGDLEEALADYQKYLALGGGEEYDNAEKVENWIRDLQNRLM